jgi:hypothetical protein
LRIDGGRAFAEGFRLVGREPLTVAGWVGLQLLISGLSFGGIYWAVSANTRALQAWANSFKATPQAVAGLMAGAIGVGVVAVLLGLVLQAVTLNAIYRTVFYPGGSRAYARLRLGGRELWMALHLVAYFVVIVGGLGLVLWGVYALTGQGWLIPLLALLLPLPVVTLFTLSGPMVFQLGGFRLFSAFEPALANFWQLLLCNFLLCLVTIGVWILSVVAALIQAVVFSGQTTAVRTDQLSDIGPALTNMMSSPAYLTSVVINTTLSVLYLTVIVAPAARAYADIHGEAGGTADVFS